MSRQEKHAWFFLGVFALAGSLFALAAPHVGLLPATGCFGLLGFLGLGRPGKLDERELKIQRTAWRSGHGVFWLLFVVVPMITWGRYQGGTVTLPADNLPLLVAGGFIVVLLVQSIATLVLCRRGILHV